MSEKLENSCNAKGCKSFLFLLFSDFLKKHKNIFLKLANAVAPIVTRKIVHLTDVPKRLIARRVVAKRPIYTSPKLMPKAEFTCIMVCSSIWPIFSNRRDLSIVRICSVRITEFFISPKSLESMLM